MTNSIILEDIMLEDIPLGLADELKDIDISFTTTVASDEAAETGKTVFFGLPLPVGDVGEVKARVLSCEKTENGAYTVTLEIVALDIRYISLLTKILKGESIAEERPLWGIGLKQTNGAYASIVNCPAGVLNADQLAKIAEITRNGAGVAKLTHAQRVILLLKPAQLDTVHAELKSVGLRIGILHHGIRNVRACCGALCNLSQGLDGLGLALELDKAIFGRAAKFDVKIAISDCSRNCLESFCVDIGLLGNNGAYDVYVGGISSSVHFKGLKLFAGMGPEKVIPLVERILEWCENTAQDGERLHKTLERLGFSEAEKKKEALASAAALFEHTDIGDDMRSRLERTLARSFGLVRMREEVRG